MFGILARSIFWELFKVFALSLIGITGIVVMAGNVRPMEDLLVEQMTYMGITGQQLENAKTLQAKVLETGQASPKATRSLNIS